MLRAWATLVLLAVSAGAQQASLEQAWNLAGAGRRDEAVRILQQLVQREPSNADGRLLLGSLLMEQGRREDSLAQLNAAVALRPHSEEANNALGEAYKRFGDLPAAETAFKQALSIKPDYGIAELNLGDTLLQQNDLTSAGKHLDRAIVLLGNSDDAADALFLRSRIEGVQGQNAQAAKDLDRAVRLRPQFAPAWSDLGQARKNSMDEAGALAAFKRAVAIKSDDAVAQYRLGAEYLHQNDTTDAIQHLQLAKRLNPTDQSTLNALQMALRQGGDAAAANEVRKELANLLAERDQQNQNKLRAVRINNEGAALEKAGDLAGALGKYKEAATLDPAHEGIAINYAVALLRTGDWKTGLDNLHVLFLKDPANPQLKAALHDALRQVPETFKPAWKDDIP